MTKPRVFISSTYYDLKHIRSSLEIFIESLGFSPILSEKGDIAYNPDKPLDESCYKEASQADIFVLIIGGRYGSETSNKKDGINTVNEYYESITRKEFETASKADVPIYILIDSAVLAEYQTYKKNRSNTSINYAHVDSVNIFIFVDDIFSKSRNNPVFNFEKTSQIETWLREQWSGLFGDLLKNRSQSSKLSALQDQIGNLSNVNDTLKTYLELIMKHSSSDDSDEVIRNENRRIEESRMMSAIRNNDLFRFLSEEGGLSKKYIYECVRSAKSVDDFIDMVGRSAATESTIIKRLLDKTQYVFNDINIMKEAIVVEALQDSPENIKNPTQKQVKNKTNPTQTRRRNRRPPAGTTGK